VTSFWPVREQYWINKPKWTIRQFAFIYNGYEPIDWDHMHEEGTFELRHSVWDWVAWAPGCPEIDPRETEPGDTPIPREKLVQWAKTLSGVQLPDWMLPLLEELPPAELVKTSDDIGDGARLTLLRIIGGLATALLEAKDKSDKGLESDTGVPNDPNVSGLTRLCQKHTGKKKGMSKSNLDALIKEGLLAIRK
jgi:hypothetical protein